MRKGFFAVVFGLVLLWPMAGSAHELSPIFFPLGPLPFIATLEALPFIFMVLLVVAAETLVFWLWARELEVAEHLWRVAILYVVARVGETVGFLFTLLIPWDTGEWDSSATEPYGFILFFLVAGLIAKLVVARLLYREKRITADRITGGVITATVAGYPLALAWSLIFGPILL